MKRKRYTHWRPDQRNRFMEDGGIYGRSDSYPYRFFRTPRVHWKIIHLSLKRFSKNSANERAHTWESMIPHFAYEIRPRRRMPPETPPTPKSFPVIELKKAA